VGLLQRLKHDLKAGWATVRRGTAEAANRAMEEAELLRLRLDLRKLDERIRDLCGDIGERAVGLHERGEPVERVMNDMEISRMVHEVRSLQEQRKKIEAEMDDIRSGL
jgi:hypothetical protein